MGQILLTHGYFLAEDEKEQAIMKPYAPLGLLYISAYLKARGHAVEVFDSTFGERADLIAELERTPGGILGIYTNLMTRSSVLRILAAARANGWRVILGGPESANYAEEYLARGADVIVIGEGELTVDELLGALPASGVHALHGVRGIVFRDAGGACVRTPERPKVPDLDALPLPDRGAIDMHRYVDVWRRHHGRGSVNLITARGCPYKCTWCSHAVYGYSHRRRSPANVVDEVAEIVERYQPEQLWYADDVFTISHPWLATYAAALRARDLHLPFETITRADRLQTEAAAAALAQLGCYRIWIGAESGSQRILDAMRREVTLAEVHRAVQLARSHGIQVGMFLMWGYEGEELEDIAATVALVREANPDTFLTTVSYPIKGTPYFDAVRERVRMSQEWDQGSDRDYQIAGRRGRDYYRMADTWLRSEVEAGRLESSDPGQAAQLRLAARQARDALANFTPQ
ncbi:MAG: B12-binding domain-containing radical SAM protein [Proteobacteria bacterium]|nr:B12-binding domain-containing radical SAM protein [Pseudomonadota bacterium]